MNEKSESILPFIIALFLLINVVLLSITMDMQERLLDAERQIAALQKYNAELDKTLNHDMGAEPCSTTLYVIQPFSRW